MSLESANEFWKRVQTDAQYRSKLKAAKSEHELGDLIISSGYTVTAEELETSVADWNGSRTGERELSDSELEAVAGGSILFAGGGSLQLHSMQQNINVVGRGKG